MNENIAPSIFTVCITVAFCFTVSHCTSCAKHDIETRKAVELAKITKQEPEPRE